MIFKIKAAHAIALSATVTFLTIGGIVHNVDDASKPPLDPTKMTTSITLADIVNTDGSKSDAIFNRPIVPAHTTGSDLQDGYWAGDIFQSGRVTDDELPETIISTEQNVPITSPTTNDITPPTTSIPSPTTSSVVTNPQITTTKPQTTTTKPQTTTTKPQTTTTKPQTTTTKPVTTTKPITTTTAPITTTTPVTTLPPVTTAPPVTSLPPVTTEPPIVRPFPKYPDITIQSQGGLIDVEDPKDAYKGGKVSVTGADRDLLERLVYGEAGNQGPVGIALVAQCIRDAMLYEGFDSVAEVRTKFQYAGSIYRGTSDLVKEVVAYIFDEGGYAVKHPILYFYAPRNGIPSSGGFHESQVFVVQYKNSRFFWKLGGKI